MKALLLSFLLLFFTATGALAQRTLTGTVTDSNGDPLYGVTVSTKSGKGTAVTDLNGKYSIKIEGENAVLVFRYVGKGPAAVMHVKDFCLEEFVEFMIEHPHIGVFNNGELLYELYRVTDSGSSMNVDVTDCDTVTASIDNVGGVIVCLAY
jgi:hypothetical protein